MTRWTLRILFLLVLGAVTTVGVAWALANIQDLEDPHWNSPEGTYQWRSVGFSAGYYGRSSAIRVLRPGGGQSAEPRTWADWFSCGFPALAMTCRPFIYEDQSASVGSLFLPLRPILPGFIINTFFYAAIWFVLFFGFGFVKRTIHRKGGRCVRCGYDLRGQRQIDEGTERLGEEGKSIGCPECGWNRAEADAS